MEGRSPFIRSPARSRRTPPSAEVVSWRLSPLPRPPLAQPPRGSNTRSSPPTLSQRAPSARRDLHGLARQTGPWSPIFRPAPEIVRSNSAKSHAPMAPLLCSPSLNSCRRAAGPRSLNITRLGHVPVMPYRAHNASSVGAAGLPRRVSIQTDVCFRTTTTSLDSPICRLYGEISSGNCR